MLIVNNQIRTHCFQNNSIDSDVRCQIVATIVQIKENYRQTLVEKVPRGRMAQPGEVVELIAFLAGDKAAYITGEAVLIAGGKEMHRVVLKWDMQSFYGTSLLIAKYSVNDVFIINLY